MPNPLTTVDLSSLIVDEANAQGVPPSIALGVAQTESGISQWTPSGSLVTSSTGALGIFQLEPTTAAGLGVDPTDVNQNIQGGIAYLAQLYQKYGNWQDALAAYNWGPSNVDSSSSIPSSVAGYVSTVLSKASTWASQLGTSAASAVDLSSPTVSGVDLESGIQNNGSLVLLGIAAAIAVGFWLLD